tara:strand:- start:50464 stop:50874 length:411 start_codon:yes stop_codon:yes gene_type:complete
VFRSGQSRKEGVLRECELAEFDCGVDEFLCWVWGKDEVASLAVGGFGVGVAVGGVVGFAVDAVVGTDERIINQGMELQFAQSVNAADCVLLIEVDCSLSECSEYRGQDVFIVRGHGEAYSALGPLAIVCVICEYGL